MKMELDGLKNIWNKQTTGDNEKISTAEIYKMIHAKSSTTVKWIFMISLIELGLGVITGILSAFFDSHKEGITHLKSMGIYEYLEIISVIITVVILGFIGAFFYQYKKISVAENIRELINTIVNTRKIVRYYILFNLGTSGIIFTVSMLIGISQGYTTAMQLDGIENPHIPLKIWILSSIIVIITVSIIITIVWYIYKLIYGRLLKKLHKNHQELLELE
ncbi:MAG: hypothetical protein COB98_10385 [Flavobacteriaceae bacterium]|nr:MAG: hypothetical protein COB98_10385 [Flavobacteriaceae bacterium]